LGITCNSSFGNPDKGEHGLVEVAAEERHGLIFVATKPGVSLNLDEYLGDEFEPGITALGFDKVQASKAAPIPLDGNWKCRSSLPGILSFRLCAPG